MDSDVFLQSTQRHPHRRTCDLLTDLLRKEWGFKGMVVSDWYGGRDFVAMVNAGNDMIQPGHPQQVAILKKAIRQGNLSIELVDRNINAF